MGRITGRSQLSIEQASLLLKVLLALAIVVSTVAASLISLYLQRVVPSGAGPAYAIFDYNQEVVGVSILGAVLPILVAVIAIVVIYFFSWPASVPRHGIGLSFWFAVFLTTVLSVAAFFVSGLLYGGLYLTHSWAEGAVFVGAAGGVAYAWFNERGRNIARTTAECYAIGTIGMALSDVVRTSAGLVSLQGGVAVWGGGGLLDLVFWFGIYLALGSMIFGSMARVFVRATRTSWTLKVRSTAGPMSGR